MHIVQLAPSIGPGSGVAGVAYHLEREFLAMGHTVEQFTLATAGWRPRRSRTHPMLRKLVDFRRVVWFDTVGTVRARRFLAARPDAVSVCHGALLVGDVYVNHGIVSEAMRARGNTFMRMARNPTHPFTFVRDLVRYRGRTHLAVVALSADEPARLRHAHGRVRAPIQVIPNGVDVEAYRLAEPDERRSARAAFALAEEARVALFIGHEFGRKGLDLAIEALVHAPTVLLLVAGGESSQAISRAAAHAQRLGVSDRVLLLGPRTDLALFFAASDMFVLPSYYESHGLVILEALASGLPVIVTPVGCAPEVIEQGVNGFLVTRDPLDIGRRMEQLADSDPGAYASAARASVERRDWHAVAEQYVALLQRITLGPGHT